MVSNRYVFTSIHSYLILQRVSFVGHSVAILIIVAAAVGEDVLVAAL